MQSFKANLPGYTSQFYRKILFLLPSPTVLTAKKVKGTINRVVQEVEIFPVPWNLLPPWCESLYLWHTNWCYVKMWGTGVYSGFDQGENLRWKSHTLSGRCFGIWPVCQFCYPSLKPKTYWRRCNFTIHNTALKSFSFWLMYFKQLNIFSINFTAFHLPLNRGQWEKYLEGYEQ